MAAQVEVTEAQAGKVWDGAVEGGINVAKLSAVAVAGRIGRTEKAYGEFCLAVIGGKMLSFVKAHDKPDDKNTQAERDAFDALVKKRVHNPTRTFNAGVKTLRDAGKLKGKAYGRVAAMLTVECGAKWKEYTAPNVKSDLDKAIDAIAKCGKNKTVAKKLVAALVEKFDTSTVKEYNVAK